MIHKQCYFAQFEEFTSLVWWRSLTSKSTLAVEFLQLLMSIQTSSKERLFGVLTDVLKEFRTSNDPNSHSAFHFGGLISILRQCNTCSVFVASQCSLELKVLFLQAKIELRHILEVISVALQFTV